MHIKDLYSVAVTDKHRECRDFYGLSITYPLPGEPWGQRRFAVQDPAGTWVVVVVEHIEPAPGYWDKYVSPRPSSSGANYATRER